MDFVGDQCSKSAERNEHYSPSLLIEFDGFQKTPPGDTLPTQRIRTSWENLPAEAGQGAGESSASNQGERVQKQIQEAKKLKSSASHVSVSCSDFFLPIAMHADYRIASSNEEILKCF